MLKEHGSRTQDGRWHSGAAARNWQAIAEIVTRILPEKGTVVEIASGTGQHIIHFAETEKQLCWQASEPDDDLRRSIEQAIKLSGLTNLPKPLMLDVLSDNWVVPTTKLMLNVNMLHVAPIAAGTGLFNSAARSLEAGGYLYIYGPFLHQGQFNSVGNEKFHHTLQANNPEWGLREIDTIITLGTYAGFDLQELVSMPANNTSLIFRKTVSE